MARPSKYTPETVQTICHALKLGATRTAAADYAGVSYDSFKRWFDTKAEFCEAVKKAEAELQLRCLARVVKAAEDGSWQAAMTLLERRFAYTKPRETASEEPVDASKMIIAVDVEKI